MISFLNPSIEFPFTVFKKLYEEASNAGQKNIEAISISSYSKKNSEVNSRYVNLKFVDGNRFIFFSNYQSKKSLEFEEHNQISALIYWNEVDIQVRLKAYINKTSNEYNESYFKERIKEKNALAISSNQSQKIDSYKSILSNYEQSLNSSDLEKCPDYWGGFSFEPYYFEFWKGNASRINKRDVYEIISDEWKFYILQP